MTEEKKQEDSKPESAWDNDTSVLREYPKKVALDLNIIVDARGKLIGAPQELCGEGYIEPYGARACSRPKGHEGGHGPARAHEFVEGSFNPDVKLDDLDDEQIRDALTIANAMLNAPENQEARITAQLEHDGFTRIGLQMSLWAKLYTEPMDTHDHVRLCFVKDGVQIGDSVPWPMFVKSLGLALGLSEEAAETLVRVLAQAKEAGQ